MAFTQSDLDAIDAAIASGALTVRSSDGKQVTYRSIEELTRARKVVADSIAAASTTATRMYPRYQVADFSDS